MVDFQSRDTRRGHADSADPAATEEAEAPEAADQGADEEDELPDSLGIGLVRIARENDAENDPAVEAVTDAFGRSTGSVVTREFIAPEYDGVQSSVTSLCDRSDVDLVVTVGGTGVGPADVTPGAVDPLFDRELPGFGETLRAIAFDEIGPGVVGLRPIAGIVDEVPVFCLPGEPWAARLGVAEVLDSEARSLVAGARGLSQ